MVAIVDGGLHDWSHTWSIWKSVPRYPAALELERLHGEAAPDFIAQRVRDLTMLGDITGAAYWREIGRWYGRLQRRRRLS